MPSMCRPRYIYHMNNAADLTSLIAQLDGYRDRSNNALTMRGRNNARRNADTVAARIAQICTASGITNPTR